MNADEQDLRDLFLNDAFRLSGRAEAFLNIVGLGVLAVASGMLGLGVAFVAVPFLALFMDDLVHEVQPLSLLLNGITALFAAFGFARSG